MLNDKTLDVKESIALNNEDERFFSNQCKDNAYDIYMYALWEE